MCTKCGGNRAGRSFLTICPIGRQERAEQKDELARLIARLQALREIDRAALLMRALKDLPYEGLALALGVSVSAAKVKVHRARMALERWRDS